MEIREDSICAESARRGSVRLGSANASTRGSSCLHGTEQIAGNYFMVNGRVMHLRIINSAMRCICGGTTYVTRYLAAARSPIWSTRCPFRYLAWLVVGRFGVYALPRVHCGLLRRIDSFVKNGFVTHPVKSIGWSANIARGDFVREWSVKIAGDAGIWLATGRTRARRLEASDRGDESILSASSRIFIFERKISETRRLRFIAVTD